LPRLEILATNGEIQKRILWLDTRRNGVYAGWFSNGDNHISYHVDGNFFWTVDGKTNKTATFSNLIVFKNMQQVASVAFDPDIYKVSALPDYTMKRRRYVVFIDVRKFEHENLFGCNIILLEPYRFDMLTSQRGIHITEVHIFFEFHPWVIVEVYRPNK
jgi:hypothetical protein